MECAGQTCGHERVLVIGAGVAGATAALELSRGGAEAVVVERDAWPGGHVARFGCKAAAECLGCNVCMGQEALADLGRIGGHPGVSLHTGTTVTNVTPQPDGRGFSVRLEARSAKIDAETCTRCGVCVDVCPEGCISASSASLDGLVGVDVTDCLRFRGEDCAVCSDACPAKAISAEPMVWEEVVDHIILATGHRVYDPGEERGFGYGRVPNVVSALDVEWSLAGARAVLRRKTDGAVPKRIAFVQCVGSRCETIHRTPDWPNTCSTVCCAYALRMCGFFRHAAPESEITVYYMDLQHTGRGHEVLTQAYLPGVTLVRARPYELNAGAGDSVVVTYEDQSECRVKRVEHDLVILSVGIRPQPEVHEMAAAIGVPLDENGFFAPWQRERQTGAMGHVIPVGSCAGPADIATSVSQARAAAQRLLRESRRECVPDTTAVGAV